MVKTMPAEKQFKLGITSEFKPLWDEFDSLAPGMKKSKIIRYLIYKFLYNNGNKTRNKFEDASSKDWEYVEGALKVYNKFIKKNTKPMEKHNIEKRKFWIEEYNYKIKNKVITEPELKKLKSEGFTEMKTAIPYYRIPDIDQANDRIVLKRMNGNKHEQITRYLSRPDEFYVKCKWRNNSYPYYEEAYNEFKDLRKRLKNPFPTTMEFIDTNKKLIGKLRKNNLLDVSLAQRYSLYDSKLRNENTMTPWKETPKELDDCMPLNKFHIETKENLKKLRRDERVIYNHSTILRFKLNGMPKIIGPRKETTEEANEWRLYDE